MRLSLTIQAHRLTLDVPEKSVFVPNAVGLLNAATMRVRAGDLVLDAGTGCGLHAILAAKLGARRVIACDVNPYAIRAAARNARANGVADRVVFIHGSFERAVARSGGGLGLVVSTLPNTPSGHRYARERAMRETPLVGRYLLGGEGGSMLTSQLVRAAAPRLAPDGRIHLHVVDWMDKRRVYAALRESGLRRRVVARAHIPLWGQRCNARTAFRRRAVARPWLLRYEDLPAAPGTGVAVLEAARRPRPPARPPAPTVLVEVVG